MHTFMDHIKTFSSPTTELHTQVGPHAGHMRSPTASQVPLLQNLSLAYLSQSLQGISMGLQLDQA